MLMKKTTLFLLALLLVTLLCAVACGNSTVETTTDTQATTAPTTTSQTVDTTGATPTTATVTTVAPTTTAKPTVEADPVKLLSFNLRYDITSHDLMALDVRGPHLMEIVQKYDPDSIGFCEATDNWMNWLRKEMPKLGYSCVGVGRNSGKTGGTGNGNEHSPVFYKTDKYELLESDTFWLSATPEVAGSKTWGNSITRICTYAILKDKQTGVIYGHFNTHFDHQSEDSRVNAVIVLEAYINEALKKYGDIGIVVSGDFNLNMQSAPYLALTSFLDDSRNIAKEKLVIGSTTNGYRPDSWESSSSSGNTPTVGTGSPIDYIFVGKKTASVSVYTVVNDLFTFELNGKTWHEHPVSDHYGVFCEATFNAPSSKLIYDETKIVMHRATFAPSATLPETYAGLPIINNLFSISSTQNVNKTVDNILKNDTAVGSVMISGNKHGVWELTLSTENLTDIAGLSFTTGTAIKKMPQTLRVYISNDGSTWKRLGYVYDDAIEGGTTYYLSTPTPAARAKYIKFVFSDCTTGAELVNISVYGKNS